jgi:hypothetical protein
MNSALLRAVVAICALVWIGSLVLAGTVEASRELLAPYTLVVATAGTLTWLFDKWLWAYPPFTWLIGRPDLRGTWKGEIRSEWINPETNTTLPPIETFMSVTQTSSTLHLRQFTGESESFTLAGTLVRDPDDAQTIAAVYRNDPKGHVRHRSEIHFGGFRLRLTEVNALEGEYWTDRKTRGQMTLQRVSKAKSMSLSAARKLGDSAD